MQLRPWIAWVAVVTVLAWSPVAVVQAQTVTFSDLTDAVPARFVDAATSAPAPAEPPTMNPRLLIFSQAQHPLSYRPTHATITLRPSLCMLSTAWIGYEPPTHASSCRS